MKRRLNDTAAITDRPPGHGERHTVSCREIENGFLTEIHSYNEGTGKCVDQTIFSKEYPNIAPPVVGKRGKVTDGGLGEAVDYLKSEPSGLGR